MKYIKTFETIISWENVEEYGYYLEKEMDLISYLYGGEKYSDYMQFAFTKMKNKVEYTFIFHEDADNKS